MPDAHTRPTPVKLICRPAADVLLDSLARHAAWSAGEAPDALEHALRPLFPELRVHARDELAALGPIPAWYVIREPLNRPMPRRSGSAEASVGRATLDDFGRFVDADEPVVAIIGLPRSELIGMSWGRLYSWAVHGWFDEMIPLLAAHGVLETRWLVAGRADRPRHVDFRLVQDGAGDHLHGLTLRGVAGSHGQPAAR